MNLVVCRSKEWVWLKKKKERCNIKLVTSSLGSPGGSDSKESACNAGDLGSIPRLGRSPEEGNGYPLQHSCLEKSMDCIVHGVAKSRTRLRDLHYYYERKGTKVKRRKE